MDEVYSSGFPQPEFKKFFEGPYDKLDKAVGTYVQDGQRIIDIGAGAGTVEKGIESRNSGCKIVCVDLSEKALQELKSLNFERNQVMPVVEDANDFLNANQAKDVDTVIINATLHEINDFDHQGEYLEDFFIKIRKMANLGSKVIIGDYFYPENFGPDATEEDKGVSDAEVQEFMEYQKKAINHADDRKKFVDPDLLKRKATEQGFHLISETNIRAEGPESPVGHINRRYYLLVFDVLAEQEPK
jgi:SAM-dependent methyltransferase